MPALAGCIDIRHSGTERYRIREGVLNWHGRSGSQGLLRGRNLCVLIVVGLSGIQLPGDTCVLSFDLNGKTHGGTLNRCGLWWRNPGRFGQLIEPKANGILVWNLNKALKPGVRTALRTYREASNQELVSVLAGSRSRFPSTRITAAVNNPRLERC